MTVHPTLPPEHLLVLLAAVIREIPPFKYGEPRTEEHRAWLGRAEAILEASGHIRALIEFQSARAGIGTITQSVDRLLTPLHLAYSKLELSAPVASRGAFIPGGDKWNGYAAIVEILLRECQTLLIVDPYMDATIFTQILPNSRAQTSTMCLTAKHGKYDAALRIAAEKWSEDEISTHHPAQLRYAPYSALHDRMIIVDGRETWLLSQSIKDFAARSPASLTRADPELSDLKAAHYINLWGSGDSVL